TSNWRSRIGGSDGNHVSPWSAAAPNSLTTSSIGEPAAPYTLTAVASSQGTPSSTLRRPSSSRGDRIRAPGDPSFVVSVAPDSLKAGPARRPRGTVYVNAYREGSVIPAVVGATLVRAVTHSTPLLRPSADIRST